MSKPLKKVNSDHGKAGKLSGVYPNPTTNPVVAVSLNAGPSSDMNKIFSSINNASLGMVLRSNKSKVLSVNGQN